MSSRNFKEFDGNPRIISKGEKKALKDSMAKYGDISGIVWNRRTGQIVGGNQRSKIIDIRTCEITISEEYEKPDKFGTVAIGHVVWNGTHFSYREVDWTRKKEVEANIFANKLGGQWDKDILQRDFKTSKLLEWGLKSEAALRSTYPYRPFIFHTYITASCMGIVNDGEYYFDEQFVVKEDYEIGLRHLMDKGGVLGVRYMHWQNEHWDKAGGCKDYRTVQIEQDAILKLVDMYPGFIRRAKRKDSKFTIELNF